MQAIQLQLAEDLRAFGTIRVSVRGEGELVAEQALVHGLIV